MYELTKETKVILLNSIPQLGILAGDVGIVVDCEGDSYEVEFQDMLDGLVAVVKLHADNIRPVTCLDRPQARAVEIAKPLLNYSVDERLLNISSEQMLSGRLVNELDPTKVSVN